MEDDAIKTLVTRLGRPHPSGGQVVERAAILAEGADFDSVMEWIVARDGKPEMAVAAAPSRGLHSARLTDGGAGGPTPLRFVLPPGAL